MTKLISIIGKFLLVRSSYRPNWNQKAVALEKENIVASWLCSHAQGVFSLSVSLIQNVVMDAVTDLFNYYKYSAHCGIDQIDFFGVCTLLAISTSSHKNLQAFHNLPFISY